MLATSYEINKKRNHIVVPGALETRMTHKKSFIGKQLSTISFATRTSKFHANGRNVHYTKLEGQRAYRGHCINFTQEV